MWQEKLESLSKTWYVTCTVYYLHVQVDRCCTYEFTGKHFCPKVCLFTYYELPCTKENALSCAFFKTKEKIREFNLTIHLVLQAMSLEIGWDCALLEGMLYCLMNYLQCMFFMFAWYLDWYLPAFRSVIRKYILRLFVICNFFLEYR